MWLETVYLYHKNGETLMILSNDTVFFFLKIESCSVRVLKYRVYIYTHVYIFAFPSIWLRANVNKKDTLGIRNNKPDSSSRYP